MATRQRQLRPDHRGYFRTCIGYEAEGKQPLFNLGSDPKEAERRYHRIQALFDESSGGDSLNRPGFWTPKGLLLAKQIARGIRLFDVEPPPAGDTRAVVEYQQRIEHERQMYPSLDFRPSSPEVYVESKRQNEAVVQDRIKELEAELHRMGALLGNTNLPDKMIAGTFFEALGAYVESIKRDGDKLPCGTLKQHHRKRLEKVERLREAHGDFPLFSLSLDKCTEMIGHWRNRPITKFGSASSASNAENHIKELVRFLGWLDHSTFGWTAPKGLDKINRTPVKFESEKKLSAITKEVYTPEQLATLNKHASPKERLALYVGLNCGAGAAELGRIVLDDLILDEAHPFAKKLGFESTAQDSFLRYFRPKTGVFGEWYLWQEVVIEVKAAIVAAKQQKSKFLFHVKGGGSVFKETGSNPGQAFANQWSRLIKRVQAVEKDFPELPFGTLRDTLAELLRRDYSDDVASMMLAHGNPAKADNLLGCYSNKPWGRYHTAVRSIREQFMVMFDAAR